MEKWIGGAYYQWLIHHHIHLSLLLITTDNRRLSVLLSVLHIQLSLP